MNFNYSDFALMAILLAIIALISFAVRYNIKNSVVHEERIRYFGPKALAVKGLVVGCFSPEELPKTLFIDKMKTRPMIALVAMKLKAKALGLHVVILGYPGLLVGVLMDGDDVADVEIVGWGFMTAPVIKRMYSVMAFKAVLRGWLFEYGLKVITVNGVYWIGSKWFTKGRGYPPVNVAGTWIACDKESNYQEIAGMLNNSDFDD